MRRRDVLLALPCLAVLAACARLSHRAVGMNREAVEAELRSVVEDPEAPLALIQKFNLRGGELIGGPIEATRNGGPVRSRLSAIDQIEGKPAAEWQSPRILQTRPSSDGRFIFRLPPGEYLIGAVTDVEQNEWFEPAFLETVAAASIKLSLGEGEKKVQHIRLR